MIREEIDLEHKPNNLLAKDWSKRKCYWRANGGDFLRGMHELEVRDDDVWIVTFQKCGTTWMQELAWLILNDYDFKTAKETDLEFRSPFLEFDFYVGHDFQELQRKLNEMKSPRLLKSHLPLPLLPKQLWTGKAKVIYVFRNLKDAAISSFYFNRSMGFDLEITLNEYILENLEKNYQFSQPLEHATEFFALRDKPWIYYTSFERMKLNLRQVIEDVCRFLEKKNLTEEQMEKMLEHLSFESMKNNSKVQHNWEKEQVRALHQGPYDDTPFIRKGGMNTFKNALLPDTIKRFDDWISQNLEKHNLTLDDLLLLKD